MPSNLNNKDLSVKGLFSGYLMVVAIGDGVAMVRILLAHGTAHCKFALWIDISQALPL